MTARSWRWLRVRIFGLLAVPPVITEAGVVIHVTRIGYRLSPPQPPKPRRR